MRKDIWICIEKAENNYAAFAPEVPGCIAADETIEKTRARMARALQSHIEWMLEDGDSIDGITGAFPAEAVGSDEDDDYYCLVQVEISSKAVPAGV